MTQGVRSILPKTETPTSGGVMRPMRKPSWKCCECGEAFEPETNDNAGRNAARTLLDDHVVSVHGYKRSGGQVYKSVPCVACPKPGLWKVGTVAFCAEHKHLAAKYAVLKTQRGNALGAEIGRVKKEYDNWMLRCESKRKVGSR